MAARGWELEALLQELRPLQPSRILEIGTHQGESLRTWRTEFDPELLIGIQDTEETTPETCALLDVKLVRGKSQAPESFEEVAQLVGWRDGGTIDFLYIDGDHTYTAAREDWRLYSMLVRSGGLIALDDAVIEGNETVDIYHLWPTLTDRVAHWKLIFDRAGTGMWLGWTP